MHNVDHYYLICMNLKEPSVDVIDNRNSVAKISNAYNDAPEQMVSTVKWKFFLFKMSN